MNTVSYLTPSVSSSPLDFGGRAHSKGLKQSHYYDFSYMHLWKGSEYLLVFYKDPVLHRLHYPTYSYIEHPAIEVYNMGANKIYCVYPV
jgi:hypothetical protein